MEDPSNIVIVQILKQGIVCLSICIKLLSGNIGPSVLITNGYNKGLVTALATRLLKDCKNTVILTFHMGKLRPTNLGGVLIPSAIFTNVNENEI